MSLVVALGGIMLLTLVGCGDSTPPPPPGAMRPPTPASTEESAKVPQTKEEKIAAINKSAMPLDMKKKEIEKVNASK